MKKLLMYALIPLVLSVMMTPAMAIGPQKVPPVGPQQWKNPNLAITDEGAELLLPSGGFHSWMADTEFWYIDFEHGLDASKAKIPNALPLTIDDIIELMTVPEAALEAENKWGYVSYEVLVELFIMEGLDPVDAEAMAAMWPEGIYVRFVNVGK